MPAGKLKKMHDLQHSLVFAAALATVAACSTVGDDQEFDSETRDDGAGTGGSPGGLNDNANGGDSADGGSGATPAGVPQTCAAALEAQSYIGCEYWPTATSNSQLDKKFKFAVVAANPTGTDATVTVERQGAQVAQVPVTAGGLEVIELPWVTELQAGSALAAGGAYRVTSSVPITLYQFNPLEFRQPPGTCDESQLLSCFSYTNDASLLLPKSALRGEHYVVSYPALHFGTSGPLGAEWTNLPGLMSVTATEDGTTVRVRTSAHVAAGPGVAALGAGAQATYQMNAGDVLQLTTAALPDEPIAAPGRTCTVVPDIFETDYYCPAPKEWDLTGSYVDADKPVAVLGGHECTFIPFDKRACDHLEESIFPVEALGQDLIVTSPREVGSIGSGQGTPDYHFVRVLSAADGNAITFDPPSVYPNTNVVLDAGKWIEVGPILEDFRILADNKILVAQYVSGQEFAGNAEAGDPAMSVAIPTEQYRVAYTFLAPTTYTHNFVNIVAPAGTAITLDGATVPAGEFQPIGGSGYSVARHKIDGGVHNMHGTKNFGIVVYGYASYTSYMYPGGLNLETITIVPK